MKFSKIHFYKIWTLDKFKFYRRLNALEWASPFDEKNLRKEGSLRICML